MATSSSNLAEIYRLNADTLSQKRALEAGFEQFPDNQGILVGLINPYTSTKEDLRSSLTSFMQHRKMNLQMVLFTMLRAMFTKSWVILRKQ